MSGRPAEPGPGRTAPFFDQGIYLLHLNRGKEELRQGHYEEARRELEEARRFRSHEPEVLANLAFALFHLGHYEDAETVTRSVLSSFPDSVPLLFNLGLILFKDGRYGEAREPMERVLQIAPGHRKAHLTLGLVLQKLGLADQSSGHFLSAGAERTVGTEEDDTLSRLARAAVTGTGAKGVERAGSTAPIVRPEPSSDANPALSRTRDAGEASVKEETVASAAERDVRPIEGPRAPGGPFRVSAGGLLSARTEVGLVVLQEAIAGRRGFPRLEPETSLTGPLERIFLRAAGDGTLFLARRGRQPHLVALGGGFLSVDPDRVLAFEGTLGYREDPSFEFRPAGARPFVKLLGYGSIALAVASEPTSVEVTTAQPLMIAAESVVAYSGQLDAEGVEPGVRYPELGDRPLCRFTGAGIVIVDAG